MVLSGNGFRGCALFTPMDRKIACAALAPALMLLACQQAASPANDAAPKAPQPAPAPAPTTGNAADTGKAPQDLTPPALTPAAESGVKGARNVLLSFARAIELRQFDQAWALLSPADRAKWSQAQFAAMFADLGPITVAVPGGTLGAAAGSSVYRAPLTITAADRAGRPVRIEGTAMLRRANDVAGATAEQRRWRFETLTLDWTH